MARRLSPALCATGMVAVVAAIAFGAYRYQHRLVTLERYDAPLTFFDEKRQFITLASLPAGIGSLSAQACASCHKKEYAEWQKSGHAHSTTEPVFTAAFKAEPRALCRSCHSPLKEQHPTLIHALNEKPKVLVHGSLMPFNHGRFPGETPHVKEKNSHFDVSLQKEGVTCVTCHVREGTVLSSKPKASANVPHPLSYSPMLAKAEFCGGCHQFNIERPQRHPFEKEFSRMELARELGKSQQRQIKLIQSQTDHRGQIKQDGEEPPIPPDPMSESQYQNEARTQGTLDEFLVSPAALNGETCQSCHMPAKDGDAGHVWPGRRDEAMLRKAISLSVRLDRETYRKGDKLQAVIKIKNDAGHRFPTGDNVHAGIVDVWLRDGKKTLGRQVYVMRDRGQNMFFTNQILSFDGQFRPQTGGSATLEGPQRRDTRLLAGEEATLLYAQPGIEALASAKNPELRVRVFHAGLHPGFKGSRIDPKKDTLRLIREQTLTVPISRERELAKKPAALEVARR